MACVRNLSANVLTFCLIFCTRFVSSQNSIKPRKPTTGGSADIEKGVGQCPSMGSVTKSPCRRPCSGKEYCENLGLRMLCCKAVPGSSCDAECKAPVFVSNQTNTGGCLDGHTDLKYKVGQKFIKKGKCCRCKHGGKVDCSHTKECHQGCTFNFKQYRHGEHILECRNCSCSNGSIVCIKANKAECPRVKCLYNNKYYKEGDIIQRGNGCKRCACQASQWKCVVVLCTAAANSKGCKSIQHGGYLQLFLYVCLLLRGVTAV